MSSIDNSCWLELWVNLQDAYAVEANAMGDWGQIGYSAPGVKSSSAKYVSGNFTYTDEANNVWTAVANNQLNDCTTSMSWTLTPDLKTNSTTQATYIEFAAGGNGECRNLTPAFDKLARTGEQ